MATDITVGTAGGNKIVSEITVGTAGGNKIVTEVWLGTVGGNKKVGAAAGISISSSATVVVAGPGSSVSPSVTVSASNAVGGTTFLWTKVSGTQINVSSTTSTTVHWTAPNANPRTGTWKCTVTDAGSNTASVNVNVRFGDNI